MEMENKTLMNLREHVEKDIDQLITSKPSLSPVEIENAKNAVCLIKEIDEVLNGGKTEYKYETSEGMRGMYYPNYRYSYGWDEPMMYDDMRSGRMYSQARGRDAATGRYISRGDYGDTMSGRRRSYGYDGYYDEDEASGRRRSQSYDRSYDSNRGTSGRRMRGSFAYDSGMSGHSIEDRVIDKLEQMMDSAQSDYERDKLNRFIRVVDSMKGE